MKANHCITHFNETGLNCQNKNTKQTYKRVFWVRFTENLVKNGFWNWISEIEKVEGSCNKENNCMQTSFWNIRLQDMPSNEMRNRKEQLTARETGKKSNPPIRQYLQTSVKQTGIFIISSFGVKSKLKILII